MRPPHFTLIIELSGNNGFLYTRVVIFELTIGTLLTHRLKINLCFPP